uniref:ADP-ribosylation factor-like protein 6 n=1 Tax=Macrostomum lignano TaxID=282301 RepID=A0A1I8G325_9PLAT
MYTLLSGLYRYYTQKEKYSALILGLDNAGKTTYLEQIKTRFKKDYTGLNLNKITTTVGLNIGDIQIAGVELNFWDLGGQQELQSLWDKYYAESHAVIFVIDSSDRERMEESKQALEKVVSSDALAGVPLLLLANKQDLEGCLTAEEVKEIFSTVSPSVGQRDCLFRGVSALKGTGVDQGIHWLVERHPKHLDDQSAAAVADAVAAAADGPWPGQLLGRAGLWQLEIRQSDSCFRFDRRSQTTGELESGSASSAVVVRFSDVSGVDLMSGSGYRQHRYLCICRYTRRKRFRSISAVFSAKASTEDSSTAGKVGSRRRSVLLFQLSRIVGDGHSASSAEINLAVLRSVQQTCQQALRGSLCSPDSDLINWSKPVLALANPVSGRGRAVPLFRSVTMTVLQEADIAYRLVETEYSGYARSLIREDPSLMAYGAIVAVGGDGLVHEMLNGLVDRFFDSGNDAGGLADALRRMPLACLPAGSGNGLGASLAFANGDKLNSSSENFLTTCTFNLTRSSPRPLDLAYVELLSSGANRQIVSFLSPINYGFLARIDFESERWRGCLGGARFAADFVSRLASPRSLPSCRARLAYLPAEAAAAGAEFCRNG